MSVETLKIAASIVMALLGSHSIAIMVWVLWSSRRQLAEKQTLGIFSMRDVLWMSICLIVSVTMSLAKLVWDDMSPFHFPLSISWTVTTAVLWQYARIARRLRRSVEARVSQERQGNL